MWVVRSCQRSQSSWLCAVRAWWRVCCALLLIGGCATQVRAQPKAAASAPTAVLLATAGRHASAKALDSVIGAALDDLDVVNVVARPGLDLGAVQLALDCVAETPQCLRQVTSQHEADILVAPSLARTANELVLTLLRFDARTGKMQRVLRRQRGQTLSSATLDAVPSLLRELFGLPQKAPVEPVAHAGENEPAHAEPPQLPSERSYEALRDVEASPEPPLQTPGARRALPIGPLLLGGGGVVLLGAGLVMGLTVLSAQNDYEAWTDKTANLDPQDAMTAIDRANARKHVGETNAVITNVFLGVGSAVMIASGIWLAVELSARGAHADKQVQLSPLLGRHEFGLVLTHHGAGL